MNPFVRRIGIWYKDRSLAEEMFDKIIDEMPSVAISRYMKSKNDMRIELKDGSSISFIPCKEQIGRRYNESYIQFGINPEFIKTVIMPCINSFPYVCGVIDEYEHLFNPVDIKRYLKEYENYKNE